MLLGACSKKDDTASTTANAPAATSAPSNGNKATTTTSSSSSGSSGNTNDTKATKGTTPGTAVDANTVVVSTSVWYQGFKLTFPNGQIDTTQNTLTFTDVVVENLSTSNATFYGSNTAIEQDGTLAYNGNWKQNPEVLGSSKAKSTLVFNIDEKFDASKATMIMGSGAEQQVRIALDGSGKVTSLKPVDQTNLQPMTLGDLTLTPKTVVVRYDRIDDHSQSDAKKAFLYIFGDMKNSGTGTRYWGNDNFTLSSPDGTKASADKTLGAGSADSTQTDSKFGLVFAITDPFAGDYTFDVKGEWGGDANSAVTGTAKITLVGAVTGSGTTTGTDTPGTTGN
jgi:hypothetical protein